MSAGPAGAALSPPAVPGDGAHALYAARVRKCMLSVNVRLEQRTFLAFFGLAARTLELTGDPDVLADTIQRSLCVEEGRAAALGDGVARGRREAEARGSRPLDPRERRLLERYGPGGAAEKPACEPPRTPLPAAGAIAGSLVEVSLSSLGALSSLPQSHEAHGTLWVVPRAPGSGDGLLADLAVFAEGVSLSEFVLGEGARALRGYAARFPTAHAACLCAYSVCQRNFLVGPALRRSSVYAYAEAPGRDLRTLSERVDGTPAVSDVELSGSSDGTGEPPDEPPIKRAQRRVVLNTDVGTTRTKARAGASFGDPACVVRLTGIPDAYRGAGFRGLGVLKGKTPPDRVLHGEEAGEYVMYIGFRHAAPLQKFAEACRRARDRGVGIRAVQGRVPGDCSGLAALDPGDVWCGAGGPAEAAQGPVVEVAHLPEAYRDLGRREGFWCGEDRPLLWWNLLSRVVQNEGGGGTLYFCFKYREGKEASSAKWFRKRLASALREEGVSGVSVAVLDRVPPGLEGRDVELPAPRQ
ncbi:hypothetical protein GL50803_00114044 [Giardia duodenalis]|uniref:Uncharacterized protein n=1 Tax=Giardia intestinalis (strain ATCC 50803 / WB clone C6) TaxID=184922 RepID=A8BJM2_GIAIC|nr:hypothetical protein GL50803_00114044 [Giardia intestinalis]KAE8303920.1 hypothetical protein GL50803_00114044 [Giardia intestinalis]|eukprot:XP_001706613.1 Hypothetical protein GL50803_114044 [Giardia lamblia ATCC 50803]